ncbi:putative protein S100-A1-like [Scophthalmus maximus]|uniref:EF-hand domain-containing protein n=2 Tax=Scophthalmus maximus TaxID=52904 RepID=A0A2U9D3N7_SCOMX|nr:putative protein S100-A1-like [Scophthalmus maximus]
MLDLHASRRWRLAHEWETAVCSAACGPLKRTDEYERRVMESAIQTLVKVFLKSSKEKETLGKKEFQGLVKSQLSNILSDTDSKEAVNNMRQRLDADQDGKVGFEEYMKLVGYLAVSLSEQLSPRVQHGKHHDAGHNVCKIVRKKAFPKLSSTFLSKPLKCKTHMSKEPTSNLESAMQMLIKTFHKYSGKEGDKYTLSRGELKELLLEELGSYLGSTKDNEAVEKVMNDLDANNDGEVDFTEFIILMGALTVACNDFFLEFKTDDKPADGSKGESAEKKA